jgi:hypothetical protein
MFWRWLFPVAVQVRDRSKVAELFGPSVIRYKLGSQSLKPPRFTEDLQRWCDDTLKRGFRLEWDAPYYDQVRYVTGPNGENIAQIDGFLPCIVRFRSKKDAALFKTFWL